MACDSGGNLFVAWDRWMHGSDKLRANTSCCVTMFNSEGEQQWEHITPSDAKDETNYQIALAKNSIAYVTANLKNRPALLRYTAKPHIASPFFLFSEELQTGACRAVAVAPDGAVYVAGSVDGVSRRDRPMLSDDAKDGLPFSLISEKRACFVARVAVTAEDVKRFREAAE